MPEHSRSGLCSFIEAPDILASLFGKRMIGVPCDEKLKTFSCASAFQASIFRFDDFFRIAWFLHDYTRDRFMYCGGNLRPDGPADIVKTHSK
ncbi:hypothetical protein D0Y60_16605 [Shinella sp. WSJ-2]|nr:hypothetical protein D0Y60_16605 [Shinella sp. WSJ-2]